MPDRELRRMRRAELVEIILALKQTEDRLRAENAALSAQLQERQIPLWCVGSAECADAEGRAAPFLRSGKIIPARYADPIKESKAKIERSFYKR